MATTGTATLDFGAFPGASDASVAITGQSGIVSGSLVETWLLPQATADHSVDEHRVEPLVVLADSIVAGVGFTIFGRYDGLGDARAYGLWTVAWVWN